MLYYDSKAITDTGNHRQTNQDSFVNVIDCVNNMYVGLFCVADGMGGLSEGEHASHFAVSKTLDWYKQNIARISKVTFSSGKLKKALKKLFYEINAEVLAYGRDKKIRIGTTYSLLLLIGKKYFVVHAGDSRIYLKRKGRLFMITKDQTWVNEQVEKGYISLEQAKNHPKKNVLANCLGCFENPSICIGEGRVKNEDCFLVCSDGFYNLTTTDEISEGMSCKNIGYISEEFLRIVKQRGAYDNVTILMIKVLNGYVDGKATIKI